MSRNLGRERVGDSFWPTTLKAARRWLDSDDEIAKQWRQIFEARTKPLPTDHRYEFLISFCAWLRNNGHKVIAIRIQRDYDSLIGENQQYIAATDDEKPNVEGRLHRQYAEEDQHMAVNIVRQAYKNVDKYKTANKKKKAGISTATASHDSTISATKKSNVSDILV